MSRLYPGRERERQASKAVSEPHQPQLDLRMRRHNSGNVITAPHISEHQRTLPGTPAARPPTLAWGVLKLKTFGSRSFDSSTLSPLRFPPDLTAPTAPPSQQLSACLEPWVCGPHHPPPQPLPPSAPFCLLVELASYKGLPMPF